MSILIGVGMVGGLIILAFIAVLICAAHMRPDE